MAQRSITLILLLSTLTTLSLGSNCPFSDDCHCTTTTNPTKYDYDQVDCMSIATLPKFPTSVSTQYRTRKLNLISDQISQLPNGYFNVFLVIDELQLARNHTAGITTQQWSGSAFDGPKILKINVNGLGGLLSNPMPTAMLNLGKQGLQSLSITSHNAVPLTSGILSAFTSLTELSIAKTEITSLTDNFFTSNLYGLTKLRFSQVGWTKLQPVMDQNGTRNSIFTKVTDLDLSDNEISTLSLYAFTGSDYDGYSSLINLNLNGNPIGDVITKAQTGYFPSTLQSLSLDNIGLSAVPTKFWSQAEAIPNLSLRNNKITKIERNDFVSMLALQTLQLDGNPLTEIKAGAFQGFMYNGSPLRTIGLTGTTLKAIDMSVFNTIGTDLTDVYLDGNQQLITVASVNTVYTMGPVKFHMTSTSMQYFTYTVQYMLNANAGIVIDISQSAHLKCDAPTITWVKPFVKANRVIIDGAMCEDNGVSLADYLNGATGSPTDSTSSTTPRGPTTAQTKATSTSGSTMVSGSRGFIIAATLAKMFVV